MSGVATEQIVIEICHEIGEPGLIGNQTILGKILDGIRDLSIFNIPSWFMTKVEPNQYNALDWPDGCVTPLMVCLRRNERTLALSVSNDMIDKLNFADAGSAVDANTELTDFFRNDAFAQDWNGIFNWGLGEVYGLQSGYGGAGFINHNKTRRQSFIQGVSIQDGDEFQFFFLSDGLHCLPQFVPSECKEAIELFALQKYYRNRDPNKGMLFMNRYKEEFYRLQRFYEGDSVEAWSAVMGSNVTSAPKI